MSETDESASNPQYQVPIGTPPPQVHIPAPVPTGEVGIIPPQGATQQQPLMRPIATMGAAPSPLPETPVLPAANPPPPQNAGVPVDPLIEITMEAFPGIPFMFKGLNQGAIMARMPKSLLLKWHQAITSQINNQIAWHLRPPQIEQTAQELTVKVSPTGEVSVHPLRGG